MRRMVCTGRPDEGEREGVHLIKGKVTDREARERSQLEGFRSQSPEFPVPAGLPVSVGSLWSLRGSLRRLLVWRV